MPYIKEFRNELTPWLSRHPKNAGDLNYVFTMLIQNYMKHKGESYQAYNDVMGAIEGCKLELYRRKVSTYEDKKIQENGDVYA